MFIAFTAFFWGFLDSTILFVAPDVYLSLIAPNLKLRSILKVCLACLFGSILGGGLMYLWASSHLYQSELFISGVPAVSMKMITEAHYQLQQDGLRAILFSPIDSISYKAYAIKAPFVEIGLISFILFSIPLRLLRYLTVSLLTYFISNVLLKKLSINIKFFFILLLWFVFYLAYLMNNMRAWETVQESGLFLL